MIKHNFYDDKSLMDISVILHDAYFNIDNLYYNENNQTLRILCQRDAFENRIPKRYFGFIYIESVPSIKCMLQFDNVISYIIKGKYHDDFMINTICHNELTNSIIINSSFNNELILTCGSLGGNLYDIGKPVFNGFFNVLIRKIQGQIP